MPTLIRSLPLTATLLLAACASAPGLAPQTETGGIHTVGLNQAPRTEPEHNDSLPLSAMNTPDAIAARLSQPPAPPPPAPAARPAKPIELVLAPAAKPAARVKPAPVAKPAPVIEPTPVAKPAHIVAAAPVVAAAPAAVPPPPAAAKPVELVKGASVAVREGAVLRARPQASAVPLASIQLKGQVLLDGRLRNPEGDWWYVRAGKETGWLAQGDLRP